MEKPVKIAEIDIGVDKLVAKTAKAKKEIAVLDLAFAAGQTPNLSTKQHFDNLLNYYSREEIIDIVSVISLFGYLNRWNDTLGTVLEEIPEEFVEKKLRPLGWI